LALAFQGGGVKGVSYVGVYNQITNLQKKINYQRKKKK
jgi:predicted acylesterase/phospholipase RssA